MENKNEIILDDFKITTFEPLPAGFDLLTVEQTKLAYYGIPPRPDESKEPKLRKQWNDIFSKNPKRIIPQFKKTKIKGADGKERTQTFGPYSEHTWGGVVVEEKNTKYKGVQGSWNFFPDPQNTNTPLADNTSCNVWIGIDGKDASGGNGPLQVITTLAGDPQVKGVWWAWSKNGDGYWIENFSVNFNDLLSVLICVENSTTAKIHIANMTQNTTTDFTVHATGEKWIGNCAEWIVENGSISPEPIADFGAITFTNCYAYKQSADLFPPSVDPSTGTVLKMVDIINLAETKTTLPNANTIEIQYLPQPAIIR